MTKSRNVAAVERERERESNTYLLKIGFVVVLKRYIRYRNFKDKLFEKMVCPFCVQNQRLDTG